jgi:hypothetical protein
MANFYFVSETEQDVQMFSLVGGRIQNLKPLKAVWVQPLGPEARGAGFV